MADEKLTYNGLVYKVAARARALANESMDYLRRSVASEKATTDHAVWMETKGKTRGEMIEEIITEELIEEFDREFQED